MQFSKILYEPYQNWNQHAPLPKGLFYLCIFVSKGVTHWQKLRQPANKMSKFHCKIYYHMQNKDLMFLWSIKSGGGKKKDFSFTCPRMWNNILTQIFVFTIYLSHINSDNYWQNYSQKKKLLKKKQTDFLSLRTS